MAGAEVRVPECILRPKPAPRKAQERGSETARETPGTRKTQARPGRLYCLEGRRLALIRKRLLRSKRGSVSLFHDVMNTGRAALQMPHRRSLD